MARIIGSPLRYIQGKHEIDNIYDHLKDWGSNFLFLVDKIVWERCVPHIQASFKKGKAKAKIIFEEFPGECTMATAQKIAAKCKKLGINCICSVGGGKGCDTAKVVADINKIAVVVFSTAASCDAPCSHSAVLHHANGEFEKVYYPAKSPDVVIVDTNIIAEAPVRLLKAGIGDALSTYFEARASSRTEERNVSEWRGQQSLTGMALAKLCYDIILRDGNKAKIACEQKVVTKALENVVEANTYLSTIGFESGGLGAAHAFQHAFDLLPETAKKYHGEKVAFCTICHLVLENACIHEINKVIAFCYQIGLPITLADIDVKTWIHEDIMKVAKRASMTDVSMVNMPFKVTPEDCYAAIKVADEMGRIFKQNPKEFVNSCSCNNKCKCNQ